jgi:hypothetical protein
VQLASQFDLISVAQFRGLAPGGILWLPGGVLPIRQVLPGFVFRSYDDRIKQIHAQ